VRAAPARHEVKDVEHDILVAIAQPGTERLEPGNYLLARHASLQLVPCSTGLSKSSACMDPVAGKPKIAFYSNWPDGSGIGTAFPPWRPVRLALVGETAGELLVHAELDVIGAPDAVRCAIAFETAWARRTGVRRVRSAQCVRNLRPGAIAP
jgi:hypothetical protein